MSERNNEAALIYIMGQSNAHAHGQMLREEEKITEPLKNVWTLKRDPNQSYVMDHAVWTGFTSEGYNLGETQDHTASIACYLAKMWQQVRDDENDRRGQQNEMAGGEMPDLYIVQLSIGAQGLFAGLDNGLTGMWNMDKEKVLIPGDLTHVDMALFPMAMHIIEVVRKDLEHRFQHVCQLGLHWLGSEQDTLKGICELPGFDEIYDRFFDRLAEALGQDCPLVPYRMECDQRFDVDMDGMNAVNRMLERQTKRHPGGYVVSAAMAPFYGQEKPHHGIFTEDECHYLAKTQEWMARQIMDRYCKGRS